MRPLGHISSTPTFLRDPAPHFPLPPSPRAGAKPAWLAAGSPTYPNASQLDAEMEASQIGTATAPLTLAGRTLTLTLPPMEPYAVILARFEYTL